MLQAAIEHSFATVEHTIELEAKFLYYIPFDK
jgi:hypothetical protein